MVKKLNNFSVLAKGSNPNSFYSSAISTIKSWFNRNEELSKKIDEFISREMQNKISLQELTIITNYQLEYTKIMYSCMALLDKLIRTQERLENEE